MGIKSVKAGLAEQNRNWWTSLKFATKAVLSNSNIDAAEIKAIGISYQMHGLVLMDEEVNAIRDAIIWCDSQQYPTVNNF